MRDALNATGRPIFYSICNWGEDGTHDWGPTTGNSWRTTWDIKNFWLSLEYNYRVNAYYADVSGPGGWADPDMLEIGNKGLSIEEEKTHFALWAIAKAPLIMGSDLTIIEKESLDILMNKELIAVNQDPTSKQATCRQGCSWTDSIMRHPSVWATETYNTDGSKKAIYAVVVNWHTSHIDNIKMDLKLLGLESGHFAAYDMFDGTTDEFKDSNTLGIKRLEKHGCAALKITKLD
jgi:alpha-galactosidase